MIKAYILTISNVVRETEDAVTLQFKQPSFGRIWYNPGQFITLRVEIEGKAYFRSYSICSVPQLDSFIAVTVKRVAGGIVSNYINDSFTQGQQVEVLNPRGKFFLQAGLQKQRNIFLFAAGSGITPIMSILRSILYQEPQSLVTLVYGNRAEKDIIFKNELSNLTEKFSTRFSLFHYLSQPKDSSSILFQLGRITSSAVSEVIDKNRENALYFICGPSGMMKTVEKALLDHQIPENRIFQEKFTGDPKEESILNETLGPSRIVEVELGNHSYQVKVPPGVSILDAGLSQNFPLPYSCRRGVCSTCMGKLISGEVEMDGEESLLDFEREQGYILVCQSHPTSDDTKIKMGYMIEGN